MKHILVVYLGLIMTMALITNNQLVANANVIGVGALLCDAVQPPPYCQKDPKPKVGDSTAHRGKGRPGDKG